MILAWWCSPSDVISFDRYLPCWRAVFRFLLSLFSYPFEQNICLLWMHNFFHPVLVSFGLSINEKIQESDGHFIYEQISDQWNKKFFIILFFSHGLFIHEQICDQWYKKFYHHSLFTYLLLNIKPEITKNNKYSSNKKFRVKYINIFFWLSIT